MLLVGSLAVLILLMVILILDLKYIRASRKLAKTLGLPKGQWIRPVRTLAFDPIIRLLAIGVILGADVVQNWEHLLVGLVGAALGLWVGYYRYGIQYVRAVPEHKSIVFVRSRAEYVALTILLILSIASEKIHPGRGPADPAHHVLLGIVLFESIGRAWFPTASTRETAVVVDAAFTIGRRQRWSSGVSRPRASKQTADSWPISTRESAVLSNLRPRSVKAAPQRGRLTITAAPCRTFLIESVSATTSTLTRVPQPSHSIGASGSHLDAWACTVGHRWSSR